MEYVSKKTLEALCKEVLGGMSELADAANTAVQEIASSVESIEENKLSATYDSKNETITFAKEG